MNGLHHITEVIDMKRYSLFIVQFLFLLNGVIWLILSFIGLFNAIEGVVSMLGPWLLAIMMAGNGMIFLILGIFSQRGWRWMFYFSLAFLAVNILLTFTDQFGFFDLLTLVIDIALVVLLFLTTKFTYLLKQHETHKRLRKRVL
jgi:hypothetical protein